MFADAVVNGFVDFDLQARHFHFFFQQQQHFFHALLQRQRFQNFLQRRTFGGGNGGREIGQRRWVVGAETI